MVLLNCTLLDELRTVLVITKLSYPKSENTLWRGNIKIFIVLYLYEEEPTPQPDVIIYDQVFLLKRLMKNVGNGVVRLCHTMGIGPFQ